MYAKRNYGFLMTANWSKWPFIYGTVYAAIITSLCYMMGWYLILPWQPVSVVGIAVAFYLGFKNNSSYDRTWEARKIWGSIVNNSRSFSAALIAFVHGEKADEFKKELIYRHIAWLITLTYQLRLSREWEHTEERLKVYQQEVCDSFYHSLQNSLTGYISDEEKNYLSGKTNMATQIMCKQAERLQDLCTSGYFNDFKHDALHNLMVSFYEDQGKSERIKNFPFPRQYASTALWLTCVFCILVPFGLMDTFISKGGLYIWLNVPVSGLVIWIFFLMEKIGDYSENPFEGSYNDVPISTIARSIEIDMREMINDFNIPKPLAPVNGFQL